VKAMRVGRPEGRGAASVQSLYEDPLAGKTGAGEIHYS
jgi:hypothetical protein